MADSVQGIYRTIMVEDFLANGSVGSTTFAQTTGYVLGIGQVTLTPLVGAASDVAAAAAGVPVGGIYVCQPASPGFNYLRTRMS